MVYQSRRATCLASAQPDGQLRESVWRHAPPACSPLRQERISTASLFSTQAGASVLNRWASHCRCRHWTHPLPPLLPPPPPPPQLPITSGRAWAGTRPRMALRCRRGSRRARPSLRTLAPWRPSCPGQAPGSSRWPGASAAAVCVRPCSSPLMLHADAWIAQCKPRGWFSVEADRSVVTSGTSFVRGIPCTNTESLWANDGKPGTGAQTTALGVCPAITPIAAEIMTSQHNFGGRLQDDSVKG